MAPRKITPGGIVDVLGPLPGRVAKTRGKSGLESRFTSAGPFTADKYNSAALYGTTGAGISAHFEIDLSPALKRISSVFSEASKLIGEKNANSALFRAIRYSTQGVMPRVLRELRNQSGANMSRIKKAVTEKRATPANLEWRIHASDKPMALADFGNPKPGTKSPWASPWNRSQRFKHAFAVRARSGIQIVKSADGPGHKHPRSGPLNVKVLWGPIIPKEMLRKGTPTLALLADAVPRLFEKELLRQLELAMKQAIAKG